MKSELGQRISRHAPDLCLGVRKPRLHSPIPAVRHEIVDYNYLELIGFSRIVSYRLMRN
jgi:hypothetical protein